MNLLDKFEQNVHIAPWLQFVGYLMSLGGLIGRDHFYGVFIAYFGIGVSMAGWLYRRIYP